ncbi:hypothetical protein XCR_1597 [Xanthomonas campestris pv. raphani 756C]|nr:hypothetical protein XCR_1597 [Xanthomonas campestris pv. raphani 756C]
MGRWCDAGVESRARHAWFSVVDGTLYGCCRQTDAPVRLIVARIRRLRLGTQAIRVAAHTKTSAQSACARTSLLCQKKKTAARLRGRR